MDFFLTATLLPARPITNPAKAIPTNIIKIVSILLNKYNANYLGQDIKNVMCKSENFSKRIK